MSVYSKTEKSLEKNDPSKFHLFASDFSGLWADRAKFSRVKEFFRIPFSFFKIIKIILYINFQRFWYFYRKNTRSCIIRIISVILFIILLLPFLNSLPKEKNFSSLETFSKNSLIISSQVPFLISKNKFLAESPNFLLVEKNSLRSVTPPTLISPHVFGALVGTEELKEERKKIKEYIVENGDTLSSLAEKFEISLNTLLWANDLTEKSTIEPGQKLVILPVSGVIYYVKSGDTLSEIAKTYRGKIDEIKTFNELSNEYDIYIGDILIIPNGTLPAPATPQSAKSQPVPSNIPLVDSQFILPVSSPYIITQNLHWYNAIDFSHPGYACGKPVFAAAGGQVQKIGYNNSYGYYVRILHPNGVVTLYSHLSLITIENNAKVNVADIIGYIGDTGNATGCHLHFEVRGAKNPFAR